MTQTLSTILLDPARRPTVIADLQTLVDQEVSDSGGVSGALIKGGYATAKKIKPNLVPTAVEKLLPDFAHALEPFYADYRAQGGADFGSYLAGRPDQAANALLGVTDAKAQESSSDGLRKAYSTMRPKGQKSVEAALPRLGALIDRHAANARV